MAFVVKTVRPFCCLQAPVGARVASTQSLSSAEAKGLRLLVQIGSGPFPVSVSFRVYRAGNGKREFELVASGITNDFAGSGEFGQSRLRILGDVIRNIEGMHAIDTDEKHMFDVAGLCGGSCRNQGRERNCGQQSGDKTTSCHGKASWKNQSEREAYCAPISDGLMLDERRVKNR